MCAPFHLCICPGSGGAVHEGTWPVVDGTLEVGWTQTQAPPCLQGRRCNRHVSLLTDTQTFLLTFQNLERPGLLLAMGLCSWLTERVVKGVGDRFVPLALEEGQTRGGHVVLVLSVEVQRLKRTILQRMTEKEINRSWRTAQINAFKRVLSNVSPCLDSSHFYYL